MRSLKFLTLLVLFFLSCGLYASSSIRFGYVVSSEGFSEDSLTACECAGLQAAAAMSDLPLCISAGVSLPLCHDMFEDILLQAHIDILCFRMEDHPFSLWLSLPNHWEPSVGFGVFTKLHQLEVPLLSAELHPLRFVTAGGSVSILAPVLLYRISSSEVTGWGIRAFSLGYELW